VKNSKTTLRLVKNRIIAYLNRKKAGTFIDLSYCKNSYQTVFPDIFKHTACIFTHLPTVKCPSKSILRKNGSKVGLQWKV